MTTPASEHKKSRTHRHIAAEWVDPNTLNVH